MKENARTVRFSIPNPGGNANTWALPGAFGDPRGQFVNFGGETGTATLYYGGVGVAVAHTDVVATVQANLNNLATGWGQLGVVVSVAGAAGAFTVTFTSWVGSLLPFWIMPDFSALSGGGVLSFVRPNSAWLAAGTIHGLWISPQDLGTGADPTITVYNAREAGTERSVYQFTGGTFFGELAPRVNPLVPGAVIKPPTVFELSRRQGSLTPDPTAVFVAPVFERLIEAVDASALEHLDVYCPDGMVIHVTTTAAAATAYNLDVSYAPIGMGAQRLKNDAAAKQSTRTTPILQ